MTAEKVKKLVSITIYRFLYAFYFHTYSRMLHNYISHQKESQTTLDTIHSGGVPGLRKNRGNSRKHGIPKGLQPKV